MLAFTASVRVAKPTKKQADAVAEAGREVRRVRSEALTKIKGGLRAVYRTLELPGKNPLKDAHAALDQAVLDAYGFSVRAGSVSDRSGPLADALPTVQCNTGGRATSGTQRPLAGARGADSASDLLAQNVRLAERRHRCSAASRPRNRSVRM